MSSTAQIKIAVIGVGGMGRAHVQDILSLPTTQLVAVCDIDRARAESVAAAANVRAFDDYRALLAQVELDAVLIATPHYDHTPISLAAFERGRHVLVEKPLAVHVKDARSMIAARNSWSFIT